MQVEVHNPRSGELIDTVELLPPTAAAGIAARSAAAFTGWAGEPAQLRCRAVADIAHVLADRVQTLAEPFSRETGKMIAEAQTELDRAVETLRWAADAALRLSAETELSDRSGLARRVVVEPAGPMLAIIPSNFPAVVLARKLGPALAMGCPVVVKGPDTAPSVIRAFAAAAAQAGVPGDVVQTVFTGPDGAAALVGRPEFRVISFTGSTRTGRLIAAAAVPTLAQCVLELGGSAPAIVTAEADLDAAVRGLSAAKFASAGQSCAAPSRFLVHRDVVDEFADRFAKAAPAMDFTTDREGRRGTLGPLHTRQLRDNVVNLVQDALGHGAHCRIGGTVPDVPGYYYPATVLTDVPEHARILAEEPFGPVAPVLAYADEDEAVAIANSNSYRLGAFVYGAADQAAALAARLDAGRVSVNCATGADPESPLAGRGDSGYGYEGGDQGVLAFTRLKALHQPRIAGPARKELDGYQRDRARDAYHSAGADSTASPQ